MRTRVDPRHTDTAAEFIEARRRRGRVARAFTETPPDVLEMRRAAVDLALVRVRAEREGRSFR